jgi:hypothetical protein
MRRALLLCALAGVITEQAHAAPPPADTELLEFLGSLDDADDGWQEFLEQTPVKAPPKVAGKVADKSLAKARPPTSRTPDENQVKAK